MIAYFDTSALVPLLVAEPTTAACRQFWDGADAIVTCRLTYVEAAAALAHANRLGRIATPQHEIALRGLGALWAQVDVVQIDQDLMYRAADHAARYGLRGYDAVHCAAAELIADDDTVAATGDRALLTAWTALGLTTLITSP